MKLVLAVAALFLALSSFAQTNVIFPQLLSCTNTVLMTNAEFRVISGNKIFFRNDAGYKTFHATDLDTNVLAVLHVTATGLDAKQAAMDRVYKTAAIQNTIAQQKAALAQAQQQHQQQLQADEAQQTHIDLLEYGATHGRTGWDGKQFNDNQSQGNFIGN